MQWANAENGSKLWLRDSHGNQADITSTVTCLHSAQFPLNTDTPVFSPEKSHGQRSLAGYSPRSRESQS